MTPEEKYTNALERAREVYENAQNAKPCGYNHKMDVLQYVFGKEELRPKPKIRSWDDFENSGKATPKKAIIEVANEITVTFTFDDSPAECKALATLKIAQLFPYYGNEVTTEEWRDNETKKYVIRPKTFDKLASEHPDFEVMCVHNMSNYRFIAFHKIWQAEEFLKYNEDLVRDYYQINE